MKADRSETEEIMRNAQPRDVGGILSAIVGAMEAAERMKRMKLKNERRRVRNEHERLGLDEAIIPTSYRNVRNALCE